MYPNQPAVGRGCRSLVIVVPAPKVYPLDEEGAERRWPIAEYQFVSLFAFDGPLRAEEHGHTDPRVFKAAQHELDCLVAERRGGNDSIVTMRFDGRRVVVFVEKVVEPILILCPVVRDVRRVDMCAVFLQHARDVTFATGGLPCGLDVLDAELREDTLYQRARRVRWGRK